MTDSGDHNQFKVHLGTWTNWSRGPVLGATLTLEPRYGLLLLSVTTTFLGFVASRSWRIVSLILHRVYSTPEPRDALHHQRQVVLRNSMSAISTLWIALQLTWCWRATAHGCLARTLPIILFAVFGVCAFTVAGAFISSISSGIGNEVLIDGSRCAKVVQGSLTNDTFNLIYPFKSQSMKNAANYAQQCYSSNSSGTLECATFVKSRLGFTSHLNASCPFSDSICRSDDSNLLLDSELISSDDLGINLPSDQRMFYRQVLHCAPLQTDGFKTRVSKKYSNYTRYHYGPGAYEDSDLYHTDWSFEAESILIKYLRKNSDQQWEGGTGFDIASLSSTNMNGTVWLEASEFVPIPELMVPDADLYIVFLLPDGVIYLDRTNDPWYRGIVELYNAAHTSVGGQRSVYMSDEAASPLGCAVRYQYCNHNKTCGSLGSSADALSSVTDLFHFPTEDIYTQRTKPLEELDATRGRFEMFQASIVGSAGLSGLLRGLGPSSLLSIDHMYQGLMGPLPDNQWQLDVIYWFEMLLASIQASYVNAARGPADDAMLPYMARPRDEYQWQVCKSQKIRSADYTSLSLFGLYFTYITGLLIILASYAGEPLLAFLYSRNKYKEYKYLEWETNSTLQLQRLAYQGLGSEKWTNYTDDIPKTRPGYFLADLTRAYPQKDDNDEIHEVKPMFHAASTTTASVSEASTDQGVSGKPHDGRSQGAPSPPTPSSAASEPLHQAVPHIWKAFPPIPQPVSPSPQAATTSSLRAVLPNPQAVSPVSQTVSPISQSRAV